MWFFKRREFGDLERWTFKTRKTKIPTFPQFFWVGTKDTFDTKNNITTWAKQDKGNTTDTQFKINQEWSLQNCILKGPLELDWTWSIVITRHVSPKSGCIKKWSHFQTQETQNLCPRVNLALWRARCCWRRCRRYPCVSASHAALSRSHTSNTSLLHLV